jgi:hypothetical protein
MMQHHLSHIDNEHLLGGDAEKVLSLAVIGFAALNPSYALRPSTLVNALHCSLVIVEVGE